MSPEPSEPMPAELRQWLLDNARDDILVQDRVTRERANIGLDSKNRGKRFLGLYPERADQVLLAEMHHLYEQVEDIPATPAETENARTSDATDEP